MKKLLLLSVLMFAFVGCSKDDTTTSGRQSDESVASVPHFYGMAMLENPAPETRGVANKMKLWSNAMAESELTIKFLNGIPEYRKYVKEVAAEWEKAAGVRFIFVNDDQEAMIRIGFDYVRGMQTSWSYTGTDILQLLDMQDEPTIHFAQWRRIGDAKKRSDVLRAFGQTLGLELEYRHPMLDPGWHRNKDGTINETKIRLYWEDELAEFITWAELKKMVLDPINVNARFIAKTPFYDQESVMNWPFFDEIARSQQPIKFDSDYKTELSAQDKEFIKSLYGESFGGTPIEDLFFPLIEFEFTGTNPYFTVTTTKNLGVRWEEGTNEFSRYDLPTDTTTLHKFEISKTFVEAKTRKIVIGEILEYGQTKPDFSTALTKFDFTGANSAGAIDIKMLNHALSYVRIIGGSNFTSRVFEFNGYQSIKELYLVKTLDSKVIVDNCQNLEVLATSRYIYKPKTMSGPIVSTPAGVPVDGVYPGIDGPIIEWPYKPVIIGWPFYPELNYSLSDQDSPGVTILNCDKLREISLENTRIKDINFGNLPKLEYIYLSSYSPYIVGGSGRINDHGEYLSKAFNTLFDRKALSSGQIVLRGITRPLNLKQDNYTPVSIYIERLNTINTLTSDKNWTVIWDSGCEPYTTRLPIYPIYPPIKPIDPNLPIPADPEPR